MYYSALGLAGKNEWSRKNKKGGNTGVKGNCLRRINYIISPEGVPFSLMNTLITTQCSIFKPLIANLGIENPFNHMRSLILCSLLYFSLIWRKRVFNGEAVDIRFQCTFTYFLWERYFFRTFYLANKNGIEMTTNTLTYEVHVFGWMWYREVLKISVHSKWWFEILCSCFFNAVSRLKFSYFKHVDLILLLFRSPCFFSHRKFRCQSRWTEFISTSHLSRFECRPFCCHH